MNSQRLFDIGKGVGIGVVMTLLLMPNFFGWYTAGGAHCFAEASKAQVVSIACADQFASNAAWVQELMKEGAYGRTQIIEKHLKKAGGVELDYRTRSDCADEVARRQKTAAK